MSKSPSRNILTIGWLVRHFKSLDKPPVSINVIKALIEKAGFVDEFEFYAVKSLHKLGGAHITFDWEPSLVPYAEPRLITKIPFDERLHKYMVRVVCCKDMLHIFDSDLARTFTREHAAALPGLLTTHASTGQLLDQARIEHYNRYLALIVLVPMHLLKPYLDELAKAEKDRDVIANEISKNFEIPKEMAYILFDDMFIKLAEEFLK